MRPDDLEAFVGSVASEHPRCVWLDGGGARAWSGRRSVVAWCDPDDVSLTYDAARREVVRHGGGRAEVVGDDPFAVLEAELAAGPADAAWFGYLGYACRPDLPAAVVPAGAPGRVPDAVWMRPSHVRMVEHPAAADPPPVGGVPRPSPASPAQLRGSGPRHAEDPGRSRRVSTQLRGTRTPGLTAAPTTGTPAGTPPPDYAERFARVQEELRAGNTYEVNLTHRLRARSALTPVEAYLRLRAANPAPYAGLLQHDVGDPGAGQRVWLLSSSPERYALVTPDGAGGRLLETKPIKGTTPRGAGRAEDEAARAHLLADPKIRAENLMVVDLLRHDLAGVCEPGSVTVPALMACESYATVHQLVSTVRGRLRDDVSTVAALRALFPAGSMTGAPKLRTMQVVEAVEADARGVYAGAFGWLSADGRADLGVVIRSLVTAGDGAWEVGTGGGVTVRSTVEDEWAETRWKAERLLGVLG
nr:anthranilate synthase component I family protein [Nocardioides perillae]